MPSFARATARLASATPFLYGAEWMIGAQVGQVFGVQAEFEDGVGCVGGPEHDAEHAEFGVGVVGYVLAGPAGPCRQSFGGGLLL
ncbi:MAG: hypothetical protein IPG97_15875 [Microthrixaceae bacterium]|nr:hypothetical protein [Microthrixaceae bacterium]